MRKMYERVYGSRYCGELSTKQIAQIIKKEVARDQKAGKLPKFKIGIRTSYNNIHVKIGRVGFMVLNPEYIRADRKHSWPLPERLTPRAKALYEEIESRLAAFNHDGSEIQADYFDVKFYKDIGFDADQCNEERIAVIEFDDAMKEATPPAPAPKHAHLVLVAG